MIKFIKKEFNKIKWSVRRLTMPISKEALVLEVGSGGNPYPRSNVLLDAYEETRERHWEPLVQDRPTVISFGENLPFKDKSFDFVIAAHVLEHSPFPEKFLSELQRVAHAGYIETPDAFMERINPYKDHRLEVTVRNGELVIRKKPTWIYDEDLVELYENRAKPIITKETIPQNADKFHVRFYWQNTINYKILNPEIDANWPPCSSNIETEKVNSGIKKNLRLMYLKLLTKFYSQSKRNTKLNILPLMRCPKCFSENLEQKSISLIICNHCSVQFIKNKNIFQIY